MIPTLEMKPELPPELFSDKIDEVEIALRIGKWAVIQELRLPFTEEAKVNICRGGSGGFIHAIRKNWSSLYGNYGGLSKGDVELAAVMTDTYDLIFDDPLTTSGALPRNCKNLPSNLSQYPDNNTSWRNR